MAVGTMSVAFAADEGAPAVPSLGAQFFLATTDNENSKLALDELDKILKEQNLNSKLGSIQGSLKKINLTVDINSVNGICKTIDSFSGILGSKILMGLARPILGDICDLSVKTWEKGLKRGANDYKIISEFVELIAANTKLIGKVIDGSADFGMLNDTINLKKLLGNEGISGTVKGLFVGMLFDKEKDAAKYNEAYSRAVNNFDSFLFGELLPAKLAGALPGFKMSTSSKVDVILSAVLASSWTKYIEPAIKNLNITAGDNVALQKLSTVMNFNGKDIDTSGFPLDGEKALSTQINNVLGFVAGKLFKGVTWENGESVSLVGKNIQNLYKHVAQAVGIDATPISVLKFVLENITGSGKDDYVAGIENCKTLEEVAKIVLINTAKKSEIPVNEKAASYENVLGDMLAYWANSFVDLGYAAGSGKDCWTVANDLANVYLFNKGFAKAFNLSVTKNESIFSKLDKIINMTGIWSLAGKSYKSEEFIKDVLSGLFNFDFEKLINLTVVRFSNDFGNKTAVEVLYKVIYNFLKKWLGKDILVAYKASGPFQNALSNASLKTTVQNFLTQLNAKKASILPPVLFLGALALGTGGKVEAKVTAASASAVAYTGSAVLPASITVTVNGKKVNVPAYHYTVESVSSNVNVGKAKMTVSLNGAVKNKSVDVSFVIAPAKVTGLKVTSKTSTTVALTWNKVVGATAYVVEYFNGKSWVSKTVSANSATLTGLKARTSYKFRVKAYSKLAGAYGEYSAVVTSSTAVAKVTGVKLKSRTASSITLTWTKVAGAKGYEVWMLKGKKWVKVGTTTKNSLTVKKLKANTTYQFKIRAYDSAKVFGDFSAVAKLATGLAKVTGVKAKTTKNSVTLSWKKVSGAKTYEVYQLQGKKWKKVGTAKKTSLTLKKDANKKSLKKNTTYKYKVRAVSKAKVAGDYSSTVSAKTKKK